MLLCSLPSDWIVTSCTFKGQQEDIKYIVANLLGNYCNVSLISWCVLAIIQLFLSLL